MKIQELITHCDHTLLKQTATWSQIQKLGEEAIEFNAASICIPPYYVKRAREHFGDNLRICTVIGFPNGNTDTDTKVYEATKAIENGANELDMVLNIGMLKDCDYKGINDEIKKLSCVCHDLQPSNKQVILKVIVETCLLSDYEIAMMCTLCADAGADYIKTSTGFSTEGATPHVVQVMLDEIKCHNYNLKVKAAGGISDLLTAEKYLSMGVDRLGTSKLIELVKVAKEVLGDKW